MKILDEVHVCRLLNSANFFREQKQLVKATVSKMDYDMLKDQLKKVFTNNASDLLPKNVLCQEKIKFEASNDVYYTRKYNKLP